MMETRIRSRLQPWAGGGDSATGQHARLSTYVLYVVKFSFAILWSESQAEIGETARLIT
jgi:hypothetical protein